MIRTIAEYAGYVTSIITLACIAIKPIRERLFEAKATKDAQKCLLRADMLKTYYKNVGAEQIRQYELENFLQEYECYKALKGNSFIDEIHAKVMEWEVIR